MPQPCNCFKEIAFATLNFFTMLPHLGFYVTDWCRATHNYGSRRGWIHMNITLQILFMKTIKAVTPFPFANYFVLTWNPSKIPRRLWSQHEKMWKSSKRVNSFCESPKIDGGRSYPFSCFFSPSALLRRHENVWSPLRWRSSDPLGTSIDAHTKMWQKHSFSWRPIYF